MYMYKKKLVRATHYKTSFSSRVPLCETIIGIPEIWNKRRLPSPRGGKNRNNNNDNKCIAPHRHVRRTVISLRRGRRRRRRRPSSKQFLYAELLLLLLACRLSRRHFFLFLAARVGVGVVPGAGARVFIIFDLVGVRVFCVYF